MEFTTIHKSLNISGFETEPKEDSIHYISPSLEKGVLAESFGYNSSVSGRVLGSEIKTGLQKIITYSTKAATDYKKEMSTALKDCKGTPTKSPGRYVTKGLDTFIPDMPKCFGYDEIEAYQQDARSKGADTSYNACPMYRYNEASKEYIEACVEKIYASAMLQGINDSQYYYLTTSQAAQVGIGS